MKTKKLFAATLIAALTFTACSNDEEIDNSRKEVKIVATIGAPTDSKLKATFENDGSGEFETGDEFNLSCWSPTLGMSSTYVYQVGQTTLYWDEISSDSNPIDFNAWYPVYNFSGSLTQPYKVADAATNEAKDLLMTPVVTVPKYGTVSLQFKHVMHKLVIALGTNYYTFADLQNAVISLKNLKSDAMVNFQNGTVDATTASGTDLYQPATGSWAEFIVAPQTLTAGTEIIEILIAGKTFTYKVPGILTSLEGGKVLKLTLILTRYGVDLQTGSISAWGEQGDIFDEIEFS